jgi:hypothetical protein
LEKIKAFPSHSSRDNQDQNKGYERELQLFKHNVLDAFKLVIKPLIVYRES